MDVDDATAAELRDLAPDRNDLIGVLEAAESDLADAEVTIETRDRLSRLQERVTAFADAYERAVRFQLGERDLVEAADG